MPQSKTTTPPEGDMPPFKVGAVEPIEPPEGADGRHWCRYTIDQGPNTITGYRKGGVRTVRKAVVGIVADLNERRAGRKGRVHLKTSGRPKKTAAK